MSRFTTNENSCRVDFFKPSGKWCTTEAVVFPPEAYGLGAPEAVRISLQRHLNGRMQGMNAVCLEPYCENSFPVMLVNIG